MIKIKAIQENPKVGDIKGNTSLVENHLNLAKKEGIDLLVFSEMFLSEESLVVIDHLQLSANRLSPHLFLKSDLP